MRLFVGIDLPYKLKETLLQFQSELRSLGVKGSWKSEENFHLTLEFLGELDQEKIITLTEALSKVARINKPFKLSLGGIGAFPTMTRPHTLWTAPMGSLSELSRLRDEIHLELANHGFVLENRQFKPHITIASRPILDDVDLSSVHTEMLGEFDVTKVGLFESKAIRGRRIYTVLHDASLGKSNF